ncbi:hypothetical protein HA402_002687 [Bradysia odoriphaga]|nr:hypothetical protein HA402_002687 [Bradysia odoriphaga]
MIRNLIGLVGTTCVVSKSSVLSSGNFNSQLSTYATTKRVLVVAYVLQESFRGLKVVGSVCDAVNTNRSAINKLINRNCFRRSSEGQLLEYTINGSKIWHYFDPPHLIKSVRNNLLVKSMIHTVLFNETKFKSCGTIVWNEKNKKQRTASWHDIVKFYDLNNDPTNGLFNLIPKITYDHIYPERRKMKVSLATQVFSGTNGRNMYLCWKRKEFKNDELLGPQQLTRNISNFGIMLCECLRV